MSSHPSVNILSNYLQYTHVVSKGPPYVLPETWPNLSPGFFYTGSGLGVMNNCTGINPYPGNGHINSISRILP